ncbi:MAG: RluA family pseudouridine synthase [Clostridia bacterium]|nr:RluA family pseudouridine synthase [Clostridia bacterium]
MRTLTFTVPAEYQDRKVLHYLRGRAGLSSRVIRNLKTYEDGILLGGEPVRTIDRLEAGDVLTVHLPDDPADQIPPLPDPEFFEQELPTVLYEDEDLIVFNKPGTIAVHPSHNHQGDTLANYLSWYLQQQGRTAAFRAVGRLDKGTSGVMVCALNAYAADRLQRGVNKVYLAVPSGRYEGEGVIDAPIFRPDPILTLRTVDDRGDRAVTRWEALKTGEDRSLVRVRLETGRTHQIRVHFASLGTPLLGDTLYGTPSEEIARHALHCAHADFLHPVTGERISVDAPLPEDMGRLVEGL